MSAPEPTNTAIRRILIYFGLANPTGGRPLSGARGRSRYGVYVSRRLDEDVDTLRARLDELEEELRRR
jgi:hypothetical protein